MSRLQYFIILAVVLLLVAYGNWLKTTFQSTTISGPEEVRHDPDFFVEEVTSTMMDASGKPRYRLIAERINHYPDDKSISLQAPQVEYFRPHLPSWTAESDAGRVYDKGRQVYLDGQVTMHRPAEDNQPATRLFTQDLLILPEDDYAETAAAVKITSGESELLGTGMRAYLSEGRLELLAKGKGIYVFPR
jgi:lipopolysaccharide export system protein LptC